MLWRLSKPSSSVSTIVATGPTSRTVPSKVADGHVIAGLQALANIVTGQNAGHRVAATQAQGQAEAQRQAGEDDQDGVVQQVELQCAIGRTPP